MTLILSLPFVAAFLTMPDLLVKALFGRGAFDAAAADSAAVVLLAYAVGLTPVLLIRSVVASFFARGDTATPVIASLTALGVNVVLKVVLSGEMGAAGLALSTSIGAWVNLGILYALATRRGWTTPDNTLLKAGIIAFAGAIAFELCVLTGRPLVEQAAMLLPREQALAAAMLLGAPAMIAYGAAVWTLARLLRFDLRLPRRNDRKAGPPGSRAREPASEI
jgi:putative peptidoglycan lipid II flippase